MDTISFSRALLQSLKVFEDCDAFREACSVEWFMNPSSWVDNVVNGKSSTRLLVVLPAMGILPVGWQWEAGTWNTFEIGQRSCIYTCCSMLISTMSRRRRDQCWVRSQRRNVESMDRVDHGVHPRACVEPLSHSVGRIRFETNLRRRKFLAKRAHEQEHGAWIKASLTEPTWIWGAVEVGKDGKSPRCLFRIIRKAADTVDGKPRGTAELTRFIKAHISRTVGKQHVQFRGGISDWPANVASTAVEPRKGSANVVCLVSVWIPRSHRPGSVLGDIMDVWFHVWWEDKRGWHSNNIESCYNKLKRWARKVVNLPLYLSDFMLRNNVDSGAQGSIRIEALKNIVKLEGDVDIGILHCRGVATENKTQSQHPVEFLALRRTFFLLSWSSDNEFDP